MAIRLTSIVQQGRWLQVEREVDLPDGSVWSCPHIFPIETLAMRAGEYGIPVTDTETLLDLVLHEGLPGFEEEGAAPDVVQAPTADEGRGWHLQRLSAARAEHAGRPARQSSAGKRAADRRNADVRAAVVAASDLDPELAELHGKIFDRDIVAGRRAYAQVRKTAAALQAVQDAPNGDGTSTLKAQMREQLRPPRRN